MAQPGGVLSRAGHTEAGCDLARLAGYEAASVIVEIMNEDGTMARLDDLQSFAKLHNLKIGTIADLIHHRAVTEKTIEKVSERTVTTRQGDFQLSTFRDLVTSDAHFALHKGEFTPEDEVLVRVHVMDSVRDVLSLQPAEYEFTPWMFQDALKCVNREGKGAVVLICYHQTSNDMIERIEELTSGKPRKISSDTVYREVGTGAQVLRSLGVRKMRLMSAPLKYTAISGFDLEVVSVVDNLES
jgi:3,4-dihydroxy 2-butanone 4-phosphate synthase/GTP cyclohydrolase II